GSSRISFGRVFDINAVEPSELETGELGEHWDVLCFDFDYPDMSGLKLIPQAKRRWPSAPILMLTLQNSADLAVWALRSRVFDLLTKPINSREIERMLERVLHAITARRAQTERRPQVAS